MITFSVPGPPQGKARARTVRTKKGDSVSFTPARTEYYEYRILNAFLFEAGNPKELVFAKGVPVRIRITAYYKPAARTTKKDMIKIQNGEKFPTRKPDVDNITKVVLDALNKDPSAEPESILKKVRTAVDGFVRDAQQFDDMTMLCMEYRGNTGEQKSGLC